MYAHTHKLLYIICFYFIFQIVTLLISDFLQISKLSPKTDQLFVCTQSLTF